MGIILTVVVSVVLLVLFLFLLIRSVSRAVQHGLELRIQEKFHEELVLLSSTRANCFGLKSKGVLQLRGNGALVLTEDSIVFLMAVAGREYEILLNSIVRVDAVGSFLGKSIFRPLLHLSFRNSEGAEDEIAWYVSDADRWISEIKARGGNLEARK